MDGMAIHRTQAGTKGLGPAASIVTAEKVEWAAARFEPFKTLGVDGIFPAMLQHGLEVILGPLTKILRACMALGYAPKTWKITRVVFIAKPGRNDYDQAGAFRTISLTSFLLKTLERWIGTYETERSESARFMSYSLHTRLADRRKQRCTGWSTGWRMLEKGTAQRWDCS